MCEKWLSSVLVGPCRVLLSMVCHVFSDMICPFLSVCLYMGGWGGVSQILCIKIWFHPAYSFRRSECFLVEVVLPVSMLVSVPGVDVEPQVTMVPASGETVVSVGHLGACLGVGNCS